MLLFYLPGFQSSDCQEFHISSIHSWSGREETIRDPLGRMKRFEERVLAGEAFCNFEAGRYLVVIVSREQVTKEIDLQFN